RRAPRTRRASRSRPRTPARRRARPRRAAGWRPRTPRAHEAGGWRRAQGSARARRPRKSSAAPNRLDPSAVSLPRRGEDDDRAPAARVNPLVIENPGKLPLLVLAGTVVRGGKQDRQIGADFVIEAGKTVPVDAFCVEHGRWDATRDGVATGGRFKSEKVLAQA